MAQDWATGIPTAQMMVDLKLIISAGKKNLGKPNRIK
jgi:hypothetical protein